jgi:tetratricopeptide (TPR) repeat protein
MAGSPRAHDVFLSFSWADVADVDPIDAALRQAGLSVFRDSRAIEEFDGISAELTEALASVKVLVAYYSATFPTRPACQWELTTAFIAAQRHGDPRLRVLTVNPEPNAAHLAPVELVDARYFVRPGNAAERARLAQLVRDRVLAATGPLGPAPDRADPGLPPQLQRTGPFVGRFPQLWQVHSALHNNDFPASTTPIGCPVAVLRGIAGVGKSSLAARYGFLFRDAFPGGIYWTGPLDAAQSGQEAVAQFHTRLRELAGDRLGLRVAGATPDRLRTLVAEHFDRVGRPALWIVDDVPSGLAPDLLDQLLIPSPLVRTLLTSRGSTANWGAPVIELGGLTSAEGQALFAEVRAVSGAEERAAVTELVDRAGGHPMAIRLVAQSLRNTQGVVSGPEFVRRLSRTATSVADVVRDELPTLGEPARRILRLAAVLAAAPFPLTLAAEALGESGTLVGAGVTELAERGLVEAVTGGVSVHALVSDTVRAVDPAEPDLVKLADVVLRMVRQDLADPDSAIRPGHLRLHARVLAGRPGAAARKLDLLRAVVDSHDRQGEFAVAGTVVNEILAFAPDSVHDLLTGARIMIACGRFRRAVEHARRALDLAAGNERVGYRAGLLAARALDQLGQYVAADELFWGHYEDQPPPWMSEPEWRQARAARVTGLRLRGQLKAALATADSLLAELARVGRGDPAEEPALTVTLELARLRLQTGQIKVARQAAADVVSACQRAGRADHPKCLAAVGIHAEAQMVLDLPEMRLRTEEWERSERELRVLHEKYRAMLGRDNPVTLQAAVQRDRALVALGRPREALAALTGTEQLIVAALGADHPLRGQVRYAMNQCHGQLKDFHRSRDILAELLPLRARTLGPLHPDTLTTRLDLGIAMILTGSPTEGRRLVTEAHRHLGTEVDWQADVRIRSLLMQGLSLLPPEVIHVSMFLDRLLSKKKNDQ